MTAAARKASFADTYAALQPGTVGSVPPRAAPRRERREIAGQLLL
jgi:hypothetical protein